VLFSEFVLDMKVGHFCDKHSSISVKLLVISAKTVDLFSSSRKSYWLAPLCGFIFMKYVHWIKLTDDEYVKWLLSMILSDYVTFPNKNS